jgi:hypothetical protein
MNLTPGADRSTTKPGGRDPANVVLQFFRYLDDRNYGEIPNLFCNDGVWHRRGVPTKGATQIRRSLSDIPPIMPTVHLVTNLQIEQNSPDQAKAVFYVTVFRSSDNAVPKPPPWPMKLPLSLMLYRAELAHVGDEWLFKSMRNAAIFQR